MSPYGIVLTGTCDTQVADTDLVKPPLTQWPLIEFSWDVKHQWAACITIHLLTLKHKKHKLSFSLSLSLSLTQLLTHTQHMMHAHYRTHLRAASGLH